MNFEERDRSRITLVVISSIDVFTLKKGGAQTRTYNLVLQMIRRGFNVIILEPRERSRDVNEINSTKLTIKKFKKFMPQNLNDLNIFLFLKLCKILVENHVDAIQVEGPSGVLISKVVTKLLRKNIKVIYDAHNVEGDRVKFIKNLPLIKRMLAPLVIPLVERMAVDVADHIICVSCEDKRLFMRRYGVKLDKLTIIPSGANSVSLCLLNNKDNIRREYGIRENEVVIVFHGTYTYQPNKEAVQLIVNFIAPKIAEKYSNVKFIVAGKDVPKLQKGNVKLVGFVDDLYSLLRASHIAIVPIVKGGGTRLKIMDYMAVGLPIVTTRKGIEGIEAENGMHAIIVDDVDIEFVRALEFLIENERERERLGKNARRLFEEKYDWDRIGERLRELYRGLLRKEKGTK